MLAFGFFVVALLYASVGFGGGSSYLALLVLVDTPYQYLPILALICNITVVTGNSINYVRAGEVNWRLLWPLMLFSVPMAFVGGQISIEREHFLLLLGFSLLAAGGRMLQTSRQLSSNCINPRPPWHLMAIIGGSLGLLSGLVGIGGGIFLAPILYYLRLGNSSTIASCASLFILVNSIAGLMGQAAKLSDWQPIIDYWPLVVMVLIGGQIGNRTALALVSQQMVTRLTALLVLFVGTRLVATQLMG